MKFNNLYSSILGAALLFGAYGCTDEVSYTPAEKFEGDNVYFETASSSVSLPENATEFEVEIQRYGSTGDLTVNLKNSVVDNEGSSLTDVFTVPSSVTFTGNEATSRSAGASCPGPGSRSGTSSPACPPGYSPRRPGAGTSRRAL